MFVGPPDEPSLGSLFAEARPNYSIELPKGEFSLVSVGELGPRRDRGAIFSPGSARLRLRHLRTALWLATGILFEIRHFVWSEIDSLPVFNPTHYEIEDLPDELDQTLPMSLDGYKSQLEEILPRMLVLEPGRTKYSLFEPGSGRMLALVRELADLAVHSLDT